MQICDEFNVRRFSEVFDEQCLENFGAQQTVGSSRM